MEQMQFSGSKRGPLTGGDLFGGLFLYLADSPAAAADSKILAMIFDERQEEERKVIIADQKGKISLSLAAGTKTGNATPQLLHFMVKAKDTHKKQIKPSRRNQKWK